VKRSWRARLAINCVVVVAAGLTVLPIAWIFISAFTPSAQLLKEKVFGIFPAEFTIDNFVRVIGDPRFQDYFGNSVISALACTLATVALSIPAGYALGRLEFRGGIHIVRLILMAYVLPSTLLVVPFFLILIQLKLFNSLLGFIIAAVALSLPFCIWIMMSFFRSIPRELQEAAYIDGCGPLRAGTLVMLPLAVPGVVTIAVFSFMQSWNEYLFALVLLDSDSVKTLPIGVRVSYITEYMGPQEWTSLMAAAVISAIPIFLIFLGLQRHLVSGLTSGSVKG